MLCLKSCAAAKEWNTVFAESQSLVEQLTSSPKDDLPGIVTSFVEKINSDHVDEFLSLVISNNKLECVPDAILLNSILPHIHTLCLLPQHDSSGVTCSYKHQLINVAVHGRPRFLQDEDDVLNALQKCCSTKIRELHLPSIPYNIDKVIKATPNLEVLVVHNWYKVMVSGIDVDILAQVNLGKLSVLQKLDHFKEIYLHGFELNEDLKAVLKDVDGLEVVDMRDVKNMGVNGFGQLFADLPKVKQFACGLVENTNIFSNFTKQLEDLDKLGELDRLHVWSDVVKFPELSLLSPGVLSALGLQIAGLQNLDLDTRDKQNMIHCTIQGSFGPICGLEMSSELKNIRKFLELNGGQVAGLKLLQGSLDAGFIADLATLCPSLESLVLNTQIKSSESTLDAEFTKLIEFEFNTNNLKQPDGVVKYTAEKAIIKHVLKQAPRLQSFTLMCDYFYMNHEDLETMLPQQLLELTSAIISVKKKSEYLAPIDLSRKSLEMLQNRAPNLTQIGDLTHWGENFSQEDIKQENEKWMLTNSLHSDKSPNCPIQ